MGEHLVEHPLHLFGILQGEGGNSEPLGHPAEIRGGELRGHDIGGVEVEEVGGPDPAETPVVEDEELDRSAGTPQGFQFSRAKPHAAVPRKSHHGASGGGERGPQGGGEGEPQRPHGKVADEVSPRGFQAEIGGGVDGADARVHCQQGVLWKTPFQGPEKAQGVHGHIPPGISGGALPEKGLPPGG